MRLEEAVRRFILSHNLMPGGGSYVVALSGGPDSVALLRVLASLGFKVHAAHCNFHLRGAESDRDEAFCKQLCRDMGVPFHVVHFDTVAFSRLHKVSIEMAARELRYHWFTSLCHDLGAEAVCVAHHQDDQVETVLLNMLRGTGLKGLLGMRPKTTLTQWGGECVVVRPLLCVGEVQIMEYLSGLGQDFVVDSTNLDDDVQRNKLRLDIIPLLEKVTPAAKQNIIRMTDNLAGVQAVVSDSLCRAMDDARLQAEKSPFVPSAEIFSYDWARINASPSPVTLLWTMLSPLGFNRTQVEEIVRGGHYGREWRSGSHIVVTGRGQMVVAPLELWEKALPELRMPEPGLYRYGGVRLRVRLQAVGEAFKVSKKPWCASLDAGKVTFPLTLRQARVGDRFTPYGMNGSKLVGDFLKDRKRSVPSRHFQAVVTDSTGRIVWLPGECVGNQYKVKPGLTSSVLIMEVEDNTK